MPDHRGALAAARPVLARAVLARREGRAVRLRAGEDVVHVGLITAPVDGLALLAQRRLLVQLVVGAVEVVDARRDYLALGVLPRALPDAIARVDGRLAVGGLRREIGVPGVLAGARRLRERLAMLVGALQSAEVRPLAGARAGDEEGHVGRLRVSDGGGDEEQDHRDEQRHVRTPVGSVAPTGPTRFPS